MKHLLTSIFVMLTIGLFAQNDAKITPSKTVEKKAVVTMPATKPSPQKIKLKKASSVNKPVSTAAKHIEVGTKQEETTVKKTK